MRHNGGSHSSPLARSKFLTSLTFSHFLFFSLSVFLPRSFSHFLSFSFCFSHTFCLSPTFFSFSHFLSFSFCFSLTFCLSPTFFLSLSVFLPLSVFLSRSYGLPLAFFLPLSVLECWNQTENTALTETFDCRNQSKITVLTETCESRNHHCLLKPCRARRHSTREDFGEINSKAPCCDDIHKRSETVVRLSARICGPRCRLLAARRLWPGTHTSFGWALRKNANFDMTVSEIVHQEDVA